MKSQSEIFSMIISKVEEKEVSIFGRNYLPQKFPFKVGELFKAIDATIFLFGISQYRQFGFDLSVHKFE